MKIIFTFLLFLSSIHAHPHTFIEVYPSIKVKNNKSSLIHFKWVLDEMTSTILIAELDKNNNGKIDPRENLFIYLDYFSILKDYNYYTHIKIDGKTIKALKTKNFKATIENHRLCYSFDIEGDFDIRNTILEFGDSDFYVALILKDEFVTVDGATATVTGVDNDFYYGYRLEMR